MSKLEDKQYSFLKLLEKVGIKIPIIQRDYAQGRIEAKDIREKFIQNLYNILKDRKSINLDFVYGTIKDNYLIPLDGQQRLTTLFLLHYYLFDEKDDKKELLRKFTYETRISSREFCSLLIEKDINKYTKPISQTIKNQTWFFSAWKDDPTISGMLNTLDTIQDVFKVQEITTKSLNNITFSFLNLNDFKLTDELYIKMNARGKPLSEFENFKSHFIGCIDKSDIENKDKVIIKANLDNEWLDIFWSLEKDSLQNAKDEEERKKILKSIDDKYLNFFRNITTFFSDEFNEIDIFKFEYEKEHIEKIVKTLDCLANYQNYQNVINTIRDKLNIFEDFTLSGKDLTYEKRAKFYALILFFIKIGKIQEENQKVFKSWIRVCINLIHNTIFDRNDDFIKLLKLLDSLSLYIVNNFYYELSSSKLLDTKQFKEEKAKAKLILNNSFNKTWDWEEEFIKAEKHWYLDGQIGFLIDYVKWDFNNIVYFNDFYQFKLYRDTFIKLWDFIKDKNGKSIKKNEILIHRALLTFGDYLPQHKDSNKYTFCTFGTSLREKNENWRRVFDGIIFKQLLDAIKTIDNLTLKLNEIINSYQFNCNNWQSYFINPKKDWSVLDETKHYQIYKKDDIINLSRSGSGVTSWGWSRVYHLYSYYLYRYLRYDLKFLENKICERIEPLASTEYPCFYININENLAIDVFYHDKKFKMRFFDRNKKELSQKLKNYLLNNNWDENIYQNIREYGYWYNEFDSLCKQNDLAKFLEKFIKEIKEQLK